MLLRLVNDIFFLNRIDNLCRPSVQILKPIDVSILRPSLHQMEESWIVFDICGKK